jgi:benzoate membrane transport protein
MGNETQREPALITFLITASGISPLGIGSAFWGLVGGIAAVVALGSYRQLAGLRTAP